MKYFSWWYFIFFLVYLFLSSFIFFAFFFDCGEAAYMHINENYLLDNCNVTLNEYMHISVENRTFCEGAVTIMGSCNPNHWITFWCYFVGVILYNLVYYGVYYYKNKL